jgi:prepilin-type N-terminal cleavage/methylation domain-containing protein
MAGTHRHRGFSLLELLLVIAMLGLLAGLALPSLFGELAWRRMSESAGQLRSLVEMTRAQAMLTGLRHRIRWEDDLQQPIVEVERDPLDGRDEFDAVRATWATEDTLVGDIHCHEVIPGRPLMLEIIDDRPIGDGEQADAENDNLIIVEDEDQSDRPAVVFEPTGKVDWVTFVVAQGQPGELDEDAEVLWVVVDGRTGESTVRTPPTEDEVADGRLERSKLLKPEADEEDELTVDTFGEDSGPATGEGGDLDKLIEMAERMREQE